MARIARENLLSLYSHIIVQGINKEYIFQTREMKEKYKNLLKKKINQCQVKLLAYCIMSNHAHMLMYLDEIKELSQLMQKVNTSYARFYNRKMNRVGFVFRDRFYTQQILSRQQLYNCLVYIHNNPVKAGIVSEPKHYKYSSYTEWINKKDLIDIKSDELIYGEENQDIEAFKKMHFNNEILDIYDIIENVDFNEIIVKYENNEGNEIKELIKDEQILRDVVKDLKESANLSIRQIADVLEINRPKITQIIKELE